LPPRLLDLLEIAAYVFSADRLSYRGSPTAVEYHRWSNRSFQYNIRVRDDDFWGKDETRRLLSNAIEFLSGDRTHSFSFQSGHTTPPASLFDKEDFQPSAPESDTSIILFSGGLDSLTGAVKRLEESDDNILLVSHWSQYQILKTQRSLVEALRERYPDRISWYRFRCSLRKPLKSREETQCTRSFLFSSIAFSIAQTLGIDKFYIFENGVTSINLPRRQDLMHARASRTTHPQTLSHFRDFFDAVSDSSDEFLIANPFRWKTKTDVLNILVDKYSRGDLLSSAVSCGVVRNSSPVNTTHCGECSQCIDRRFAAFASGCDDLDDRGIYATDIVTDEVESDSAQKTLVGYIRSSFKYAESSVDQFYTEWLKEISDIVPYVNEKENSIVKDLHKLHKRHGKQISNAARSMRSLEDITSETPQGSVLYVINNRIYLTDKNQKLISLSNKLENVQPGKDQFQEFENIVEEFLSVLFPDDLKDPHSQVDRGNGSGTIDITFLNTANSNFWNFVLNRYNSLHVPVEAKNTENMTVHDIRQIYSRLDSVRGRFGLIVSRDVSDSDISQVKDMMNGGVAIPISDDDLIDMMKTKLEGGEPSRIIESIFRNIQEGL